MLGKNEGFNYFSLYDQLIRVWFEVCFGVDQENDQEHCGECRKKRGEEIAGYEEENGKKKQGFCILCVVRP